MEPQHNPYGGGPQHTPPSGGSPPGRPPWTGGPFPGAPPPYAPAGFGTPPPRRRTGLIVGLVAGGVALVVVAVTLVLVLESRPTRISDLAAVHRAIESRYEQEPFLGVGEFDGEHTVYVSLHLYDVHGAGRLRKTSVAVSRLVWENVPGSYDQVAVALSNNSDDPFVQVLSTRELRENFGARPGSLTAEKTNGRNATLNRAGDCSTQLDYCDSPAEALVSPNSRVLMERTCRQVDWSEFPAEPVQIRNHIPEKHGAESSMTYLLSPVTAPEPDYVTVALIGKRDDFIDVTCMVGDEGEYEVYSRADYADAAD